MKTRATADLTYGGGARTIQIGTRMKSERLLSGKVGRKLGKSSIVVRKQAHFVAE